MNLPTILVLLALGTALFFALRRIRRKGTGCCGGSCCGNCADCACPCSHKKK